MSVRRSSMAWTSSWREGRGGAGAVRLAEVGDHPPAPAAHGKERDDALVGLADEDVVVVGRRVGRDVDVGQHPAVVDRLAGELQAEVAAHDRVGAVAGHQPRRAQLLGAVAVGDLAGDAGGVGHEAGQLGAALHGDAELLQAALEDALGGALGDQHAGRRAIRPRRELHVHDPAGGQAQAHPVQDRVVGGEALVGEDRVERLHRALPHHERLREVGGRVVAVDDPHRRAVAGQHQGGRQAHGAGPRNQDGRRRGIGHRGLLRRGIGGRRGAAGSHAGRLPGNITQWTSCAGTRSLPIFAIR